VCCPNQIRDKGTPAPSPCPLGRGSWSTKEKRHQFIYSHLDVQPATKEEPDGYVPLAEKDAGLCSCHFDDKGRLSWWMWVGGASRLTVSVNVKILVEELASIF
jgi:hypothetical protein